MKGRKPQEAQRAGRWWVCRTTWFYYDKSHLKSEKALAFCRETNTAPDCADIIIAKGHRQSKLISKNKDRKINFVVTSNVSHSICRQPEINVDMKTHKLK